MDGWRHRFPGMREDWARFDGPAGTQMVDTAIDAMRAYLGDGRNANAHGTFEASRATDEVLDRARRTVGRLLGGDGEGVVFGPNMTTLTFAFTRALARRWSAGDEIVCTRLDHDANVTPWVLAAADSGATVRLADIDASGRLDLDHLASLCNERTRWVAFTGASNAVGSMPDIGRVVDIARSTGARTFVDAVHLVPHRAVDVTRLGCDVLACSPYKWYGPHAGLLWVRPSILESIEPYKVRPAPDEGPSRLETGTPSFEAIAATEAAATFLLDAGMPAVVGHEMAVFRVLLDGLLTMPHVQVHGPRDVQDRAPTVAFTVDGLTPQEVATRLGAEGIAVWGGNYYAVELMTALGLEEAGGAVRAGIACYTTHDEVARLLTAVDALAAAGRRSGRG